MYFSTPTFVLLSATLAAITSAQNMFTMTTIPTSIPAGSTFNITWQPTTPGTISLLLVQASSPGSSLVHPVSTIAANVSNSGAFAWIPSSLTPKGEGYAIEIVDDADPNITNYSGQFAVDSSTTASASSSAAVSSISGTTTSGASTATSTGSLSTGTTSSGMSLSSSSGTMTTMSMTGSSTMSTVTTTSSSASSSTTTSASSTAPAPTVKVGGAATVQTARSGFGLLAALGVAVLFL